MRHQIIKLAGMWALLTGLCWLAPASARAQQPDIRAVTSLPGGDHALGLGLRVGGNNGATMKYYLSAVHAFEVSVGVGFVGGAAVQSSVAYHYHLYLSRNRYYSMPIYLGAGGRISIWPGEGRYIGVNSRGAAGVGLCAPLGVAFNFRRVPLELFAEIAAGLGLVAQTGEVGLLLDLSTGVRFYL